jgi:hypothetical protein
MSDWIDDLKKRDESATDDIRKQNEIRLLNAEIVRARAPAFWSLAMDCGGAYVTKLAAAFPNDRNRQCDLAQRDATYILQGRKVPITILDMTLNAGAACVAMHRSYRRERTDQPIRTPIDGMRIIVGVDDEVEFVWQGTHFREPSALAEALIRYVCGLT